MKTYIPFRPEPRSILWHYANGRLPMWTGGVGSPIGWVTYSHRGVQFLDNLRISPRQLRKIKNAGFDFRIDTAFGQVIRACADLRAGQTWITPDIMRGCEALYDLGYAHSFESWADGALVGGAYGIQLGGYVTVESIFHTVTNAGSAAQINALLHLRDRGFGFIDTNGVPPHVARFGAEWIPHWRFMELLKVALPQPLTLADECASRPLPLTLRAALRVAGAFRKIGKYLPLPRPLPIAPAAEALDASPDHDSPAPATAAQSTVEHESDNFTRAA